MIFSRANACYKQRRFHDQQSPVTGWRPAKDFERSPKGISWPETGNRPHRWTVCVYLPSSSQHGLSVHLIQGHRLPLYPPRTSMISRNGDWEATPCASYTLRTTRGGRKPRGQASKACHPSPHCLFISALTYPSIFFPVRWYVRGPRTLNQFQ
jgi:hypothetical protein